MILWQAVNSKTETKEKISKSQSGSKNKYAKLSHEDVLDIKRRLANKEKQKDISYMYSVDPSLISNISHGKRYKEDVL